MKDNVMVRDYAEEGGRIFWVAIVFIRDGHQLFEVSFVPSVKLGTVIAEQDHQDIPEFAFLMMKNHATEFFKEKGVLPAQKTMTFPEQLLL